MAEWRLVRIGCGQLGELVSALERAGLPLAGLCAATDLFRLEDDRGPVGWAALERRGREALLRSVVIAEGRRGSGAGAELVTKVIDAASGDGIEQIWLLTETAAPFFARLGFETTDRGDAPEAIRQTGEFASTCPASAQCMRLSSGQP